MKRKKSNEKHNSIAAMYKTAHYKTEDIAELFSISPRQVVRIATKYGVNRSKAEANKVSAPFKKYKKIAPEFKVVRKQISQKKRYQVISSHPYCTVCGMRPNEGVRLEVDHIDNNATNNEDSNLQVLCGRCNLGKSHLHRFGI